MKKLLSKRAAALCAALLMLVLALAAACAPAESGATPSPSPTVSQETVRIRQAADALAAHYAAAEESVRLEDWAFFGLARYGVTTYNGAYLEKAAASPTAYGTTVLGVLAAGGDPQNVGGHDLLLEMFDSPGLLTLYYTNLAYALVAKNAAGYTVPQTAAHTEADVIRALLAAQDEAGGFGLSYGADGTAMVLQALAPYAGDAQTTYTYTRQSTGSEETKTVKAVVDECLTLLSAAQKEDGSWGDSNGTAMALVALCELGVDYTADARFVKSGKTALDGLLSYRLESGRFCWKSGEGAEPSAFSDSQSLWALAACYRQAEGLPRLLAVK